MAKRKLSAVVWQEGKLFVAKTLGLELASQGKTKKEALKNLKEALELLLEDEGIDVPSSLSVKNSKIEQIYA